MSRLACARVRSELAAFIGRDLDRPARLRVRLHLQDCASCRKEASAWLRASQAFRAAAQTREQIVSEATMESWREGILQAVASDAGRVEAPRARPWRTAAMAIGAAASVLCGLLLAARSHDGLLRRAPLQAPSDGGAAGSLLQPLGQDVQWRDARMPAMPPRIGAFPTHGLSGRLALRTLEDEVAPIVPRGSEADSDGAVGPGEKR